MKNQNRFRRKTAIRCAVVTLAIWLDSVPAQVPSNSPLVIPSALPPNIVLTIDDSAVMKSAFAPDGVDTYSDTRRFKSSTFNPVYYNPNIRYVVPSGASTTTNTFSAALLNGFNAGRGTVGLSSGYRPFINYDPATDVGSLPAAGYAAHSAADAAALSTATATSVTTTSPSAAYYAVYSTSCGDINNDNCYSIVVVHTAPTTPTFTIPPNGTPDNGRPDCTTVATTTTCTFAQESQNFANWFAYYRTRNLAMVSSAWRAFSDANLVGTGVRLAWQGTDASCLSLTGSSTCDGVNADGSSAGSLSNSLRVLDTAQQTNLQSWLRNVPASGGPSSLRGATARAGDFFARATSQVPNAYTQNPQAASGGGNPAYACRANFQVLMAGGAWGDSGTSYCSGSSCGNKDNSNVSLPSPADSQSVFAGITGYTPRAPYRDGTSESLADIAFHYWTTDLQAALGNLLIPYTSDRTGANASEQFWSAKNDPASWQHMVNFTMGIGLARSLTGGPTWNPNDPFAAINASTVWPDTSTPTGKIYDLWHAAVDSRGGFFDATENSDLTDALKKALTRSIDQSNVGASIATNSSRLTSESTLYQASFSSGDWSGKVRAIDVNRDGSLGTDQWAASTSSPGTRRIFTHNGPNANSSAIAFTTTALDAAGALSRFGNTTDGPGVTGSTADKVVNYLRGDRTNENATTGFRPRSSVIGDIVNGDLFYAASEDFAYFALPEGIDDPNTAVADDYRSFVAAKRCIPGGTATCDSSQPNKMIYAASNDGMLHGFNADTGAEVFAYVPRALLNQQVSGTDARSKLALLAQLDYNANHKFFVDGSPWVADACLTAYNASSPQCQRWATVLVGVTGAGGKGVFALDVTTNPDYDWGTSASNGRTLNNFDASRVLWDIDASSDNDLGHTIGQPVVGRLGDGEFYAIFGNGYASANGCAVLYLVRLRDGLVRKLPTTNTNVNTTCATANGLGRPSLLDSSSLSGLSVGDRITDFIYAADIQGNVWRFNLSNLTPASTWPTTNNVVRNMFQAAQFNDNNNCSGTVTVQPITSGIEIGRGPVDRGNGQGNANLTYTAMLYFGTGKFFQDGDPVTTGRQTFYALMDDLSGNATTTPQDNRCSLQQRTIDVATRAFSNTDNTTTINYFANNAKEGFFMDLPEGGSGVGPSERIVSMPLLLPNRLLFTSLVPNTDPCTGGGTSVIQAMDPLQGFSVRKQPGSSTIARIFINGGGDGIRSISGYIKNLIAIDAGTRVYLYYGTSTGQVQKVDTTALTETGSAGRGRTSWREITGQQSP